MIKRKKQTNMIFFISMILLFVILLTLFINRFFSNPYLSNNLSKINNWTYSINNNEKYIKLESLKDIRDVKANDILCLKCNLEYNIENAILLINTNHQSVQVMLNDKVIYDSFNDKNKNPGLALNLIELGSNYIHKELKILYKSPYSYFCTSYNDVYICSSLSLISYILSESIPDYIISLFTICIGTIGICYTLFSIYKKSVNKPFFYSSMFSFILGLYFPIKQPLTSIFISPIVQSNLYIFLTYLQPLLTLLVISRLYKKYHKNIYYIILFNFLFILLVLLALIFDLAELPTFTFIFHITTLLSMCYAIYISYKECKTKNDLAPIIMILLVTTAIFVVFDIINLLLKTYTANVIIYKYIVLIIINILNLTYFLKLINNAFHANSIKKNNTTLKSLAFTDELTRLRNRACFEKMLTALSNKQLQTNEAAIIVFDLNDLKNINDSLGHSFGDEYIKLCASCLLQAFSNVENIFRIGGDEFVVILTRVERNLVEIMINDLYELFTKSSHDNLQLSVAYGYAFFDTSLDSDIYNTFNRADKKMYRFKYKQKASK